MESSISLALAAQVALRRRLDVVANNIANAGTAGFKLEAQIVQKQPQPGGESEVDYPLDRGTYTDLRPGPITLTGNPLDVAVAGDEMLAVQTPGGLRYTRDGRMTRAADGTLLGLSGLPVAAAGGGTIAVPEQTRSLTIAGDGRSSPTARRWARSGCSRCRPAACAGRRTGCSRPTAPSSRRRRAGCSKVPWSSRTSSRSRSSST
jgi:flagellar basal-body rod protein FlgF